MYCKCVILLSLLCHPLLANDHYENEMNDRRSELDNKNEQAAEVRREAQEHLEKAFEEFGLGVVEAGVGAYMVYKGHPVKGAVAGGHAVERMKHFYEEAKKASGRYASAREIEEDAQRRAQYEDKLFDN